MKQSKFTDSQIIEALKWVEGGVPVPEICLGNCINFKLVLTPWIPSCWRPSQLSRLLSEPSSTGPY